MLEGLVSVWKKVDSRHSLGTILAAIRQLSYLPYYITIVFEFCTVRSFRPLALNSKRSCNILVDKKIELGELRPVCLCFSKQPL